MSAREVIANHCCPSGWDPTATDLIRADDIIEALSDAGFVLVPADALPSALEVALEINPVIDYFPTRHELVRLAEMVGSRGWERTLAEFPEAKRFMEGLSKLSRLSAPQPETNS